MYYVGYDRPLHTARVFSTLDSGQVLEIWTCSLLTVLQALSQAAGLLTWGFSDVVPEGRQSWHLKGAILNTAMVTDREMHLSHLSKRHLWDKTWDASALHSINKDLLARLPRFPWIFFAMCLYWIPRLSFLFPVITFPSRMHLLLYQALCSRIA